MNDDSNGCASGVILSILAAGYVVFSLAFGWTNVPDATRAIQSTGFTPISVGGVAWFACGKGDWWATKFTARNVRGDIVSGEVCEGLFFKGQTVRFN